MTDSSNNSTRVVVTGRGLVTPLGRTAFDVHKQWLAGRCPAATITKFDATTLPISIACEVPDFEPRQEIRNRKMLRLLVRGEDYGLVASAAAMNDAALPKDDIDPFRAGIAVGVRKEGFRNTNFYDALEACTIDGQIDRKLFIDDGVRRIPPQTIIEGLANAGLYHIAHEHRLQGVNQNLLSLGTGGFLALGEAVWALRRDDADFILAGAFDSWVLWTGLAHEHYAGVLSSSTDAPATVHRPFDVSRTGSVAGEGAAMFVLESYERARTRGANILGEILGDRLREEIREKLGASYSPFAGADGSDALDGFGYMVSQSVGKPEDMQKLLDTMRDLADKLATEGASDDELDRALKPTLGMLKKSLRDNSYWLNTVMSKSQSDPERLDLARNRDEDYQSITLSEINALAKKYMAAENALLITIKPEEK